MRSKKNMLPVAPFNLREMGPTSEAELKKSLGFFRYAHGKGADKRATIDPEPCPNCKGAVEWTLTYRREGAAIVPYVYARCRRSPKSHRWDFTHWVPTKAAQAPAPRETTAATFTPAVEPGAKPMPPPRPSVNTGQAVMQSWIQARIAVLEGELKDLAEIRRLAAHFGAPPPPVRVEAPKGSAEPDHTPPSALERPTERGGHRH